MAQAGFILSDEGRTITALNDSSTTAIVAGDPVYAVTNNDVLTATASTARAAYAYGDILVKAVRCSATGYLKPIGIALTDAATSSQLTVALEGLFINAVNSDTEAGDALMFDASTSSKVDKVGATLASSTAVTTKIGRALSGGSADTKFIVWKLTL
jgi:hypothetical protein